MTGAGRLSITGCASIPGFKTDPPGAAPYPTVHLQYAATTAGPWRGLASGKPGASGCYTTSVSAPGRSDYYRSFADSDTAYKGGAGTALQAIPASKSAITAFTAGPRKVRSGRRVKVTGRLTGTGTAPGQAIVLYFRPSGSKVWRAIGRVKVTARSTFTESARLYHGGDIEVRYGGAAFTRPCRSRIVYIRVTR
jgi:hypothetical protein